MSDRVPDLLVEQLALGELPESEAAALRKKLEAAGDGRLEEIEASDQEILRDYPPEQMADKIRRRVEREPSAQPSTWARWLWLPAAAVATALVLWIATRGDDLPTPESQPDPKERIAEFKTPSVLLKGDAQLIIKRASGRSLKPIGPEDTFTERDRLQVFYRAGDRKHGVIVSIDGAGAATLHFPPSASAPTDLEPGSAHPLADSFELDDAPEFERFFLVTADTPIDVSRVMDAARTLAASPGAARDDLGLPQQWRQQTALLRKQPKP